MTAASVVVVNYRTPDLAVRCLASIAAQLDALEGGRVVVVDNASGDGSDRRIARAIAEAGWGGWAEVLALPRNGGFSYGNNAGVARAAEVTPEADLMLLLNPDATLKEGALAAFVAFLRSHPRAAIAGGRIEDTSGIPQRSAHPLLGPVDELVDGAKLGVLDRWFGRATPPSPDPLVPRRCDWVSGAALMLRRDAFERVGGLDEGFFLYFEEVDLCRRLLAAGWEVWHVPAAAVVHVEGASTGITNSGHRRPAYWFASRRRYFVKAHGIGGLVFADLLRAVGTASFMLRRRLRFGNARRHGPMPRAFLRDLLFGDAKAFLKGELHGIGR